MLNLLHVSSTLSTRNAWSEALVEKLFYCAMALQSRALSRQLMIAGHKTNIADIGWGLEPACLEGAKRDPPRSGCACE